MPWPTQIWNPNDPNANAMGMVPFTQTTPGDSVLQKAGVSHEVYKKHRKSVSDPGLTAWDAMSNPFFKAMAEKDGYDWNELQAEFTNDIGAYENQSFSIQTQEATTSPSALPGTGMGIPSYHGNYSGPGRGPRNQPAQYETFSSYEEAMAWADENGFDQDDIQLTAGRDRGPSGDEVLDEDDERFWGIDDSKWNDRLTDWARRGVNVVSKFKLQDAPIIREGPSASDYGIVREDDNIFAHYGLDRPPAAPKELATTYQWDLKPTWTSNLRYSVPPGLKAVNLRGDMPTPHTSNTESQNLHKGGSPA